MLITLFNLPSRVFHQGLVVLMFNVRVILIHIHESVPIYLQSVISLFLSESLGLETPKILIDIFSFQHSLNDITFLDLLMLFRFQVSLQLVNFFSIKYFGKQIFLFTKIEKVQYWLFQRPINDYFAHCIILRDISHQKLHLYTTCAILDSSMILPFHCTSYCLRYWSYNA